MTSSCRFEDVQKDQDSSEKTVIHYVPFKVEYDGPADVKTKFTDTARPHSDLPEDLTLINRFRGRPLAGQKVELPDNYEGVVLTNSTDNSNGVGVKNAGKERDGESDKGFSNKSDKTVQISTRFESMTYWNWDRSPTVMDTPVKLNDWLDLSSLLHEHSTTP